ncbi:MAG: alpha-L-glutamate ligase-like protein [Ekhidna sp.]|nr:alpha-L-glutamate ligase-like protein [Ekhidna sp.]
MNWLSRLGQMRSSILGMNERNLGFIYPNNARVNYKYADDKYLAKSILHKNQIACPRTYTVVDSIGKIEEAWQSASEWNELVIKPAKGAGGKGILILKRKKEGWMSQGRLVSDQEIFTHIANTIFGIYSFGDSDVALIEEYVRPHRVFHEIFPEGVPDIRILLLKKVPVMGMLRMPTSQSNGKANLHQGGLGIGVDMQTGKLKSAYDGVKHMDDHPDTNHPIIGIQLPYWENLIRMSVKAACHFPLDYLGVDLVIDDRKGPMIMELNVRPGLGIQLANKEGLKQAIQRAKQKNQLY